MEMPEKRKQHSIENEDQQNIRKIIDLFNQNLAENKQLLSEIYKSGNQCITQTDLILAASQNKRADVLYYIINGPDILVHFTDDSIDDTEVNIRRTEAIRHALRLNDFNKVEMLYDFWCGSLHWDGYDINNIKMAGNVLKNARNACPKGENQLQVNIHCLLKYNAFQREIYNKNRKNRQKVNKKKQKKKRAVLNKKKKKQKKKIAVLNKNNVDKINQRRLKETAIMILRVLRIYDKYSRVEMIRRRFTDKEKEQAINANIADNSSMLFKNMEYIYYEVYFRKIDFNVALLILENLYVITDHLRKRFNKSRKYFEDNPADEKFYENAVKTYREIESEIYHFIYRTGEDWRLYLPENRRILITEHTVNDNGQKSIVKLTLDIPMLCNGPVMYLERESFKRSIEKFKALLEENVLRDDTAVNVNKDGKMLLNENYLQTLNYLRDHYSLVKIVYYIGAIENTANCDVVMIERVLQVVGEMLKSTEKTLHLSPSTKALLQTAISVDTVRHLQNIRNFLSHMNKGQLSKRIEMVETHAQTFEKVKRDLIMIKEIINPILDVFESIVDKSLLETGVRHLEQRIEGLPYEAKRRVEKIYGLYKIHGKDLFLKSGNFYQDDWRHTGLTHQLLQEIPFIMYNKEDLVMKVRLVNLCISVKASTMLPPILTNVRQMLDLIIQNNNAVKTFNQEISKYDASEQMPEWPDAEKINDSKIRVKKLIGNNNHNLQIVLRLLENIKPYKAHWESIKEMLKFCTTEFILSAQPQADSVIDTITLTNTCTIVTILEKFFEKRKRYCVRNSTINHYKGIETLHKVYNEHMKSIKKINDERQSREELIKRLIERLNLLKKTLSYPQQKSLSQLVRRFDHDIQFRITIEMVLADIANVLAECKIYLMYKSSKLLRNIDLGNVLDHGNPFLEVIGDVFNSHDLAAEWLDKAMMFAKDSKSIEALYELFKGKMDYEIILEGATSKMDDQQKLLYEQFKESRNWKALLALYDFQK